MKYIDTINIIKEIEKKIQNDVYTNPIKYLKGNKIDIENISLKIANLIKKKISNCWIDKTDFLLFKNDKHIKLLINKKNKSIIYTLVDNNGHKCIIDNELITYYKMNNDKLILYIVFPIKGEYLEFDYILKKIFRYCILNIDLSVLITYLKLMDYKYNDSKYIDLQKR